MNLLELADWINKCRTYFNLASTNNETREIEQFCEAWIAHSEIYHLVYNSELYKDAILANGVENDIYTIIQNDNTYDYTFTHSASSKTNDNIKKVMPVKSQAKVNDYKDRVISALNYGELYRDKVKNLINQRREYSDFVITLLNKELILFDSDIETLIKKLSGKNRPKFIEVRHCLTNEVSHAKECRVQTYQQKDVLNDLSTYNIRKSLYYDYFISQKPKEYDKKLFVNLGFYLSFDIDSIEKFLNLNGYTIMCSLEKFDKILTLSFRLGFPQLYAEIMLAKDDTINTTLVARNLKSSKNNTNIIDINVPIQTAKQYDEYKQWHSQINIFIKKNMQKIKTVDAKLSKVDESIVELNDQRIKLLQVIEECNKLIKHYTENSYGNKGKLIKQNNMLNKYTRSLNSIDKKIGKQDEKKNHYVMSKNEIRVNRHKTIDICNALIGGQENYNINELSDLYDSISNLLRNFLNKNTY